MTSRHLNEDEILALVGGQEVPPVARAHLTTCQECEERVRELTRLWTILGKTPATPDAEEVWEELRSRLDPPLMEESGPERLVPYTTMAAKSQRPHPLVGLAATLVLALGVGAWWQISSLKNRVASLEEANTVLSLSQASVAHRLAAVMELSASGQRASAPGELLRVLDSDPDEHIRILALEGLRGGFVSGELPPDTLLHLLSSESSSLVQADLIGLLLELSGPGIVPAIREALPEAPLHSFVASRINES